MKRDLLKLLQQLLRNSLSQARRRKSSGPLLIAVLTIAVFVVSQLLHEPDSPMPAKGTSLGCQVLDIYDGDTITARCPQGKLKVRLFGIDAPEMGQKPWGEQSRELLQGLLPNSHIKLEVMDIDQRYGRVVARILNGYQDVGLEMVRQGGAAVYAQYNNSRAYQVAQNQAKEERLGVWSRPGAQQEPWEWRKLNPR
ncbi:MAG: thermonuclease family protein [Candidatus Competibacteraceae bacterium]